MMVFVHSGYFYSTSSSPLLLRGASDTARILYWSFTPKRDRQLRVKDFPKITTWWLERESNPQPFGRKAKNLPMSHHAPLIGIRCQSRLPSVLLLNHFQLHQWLPYPLQSLWSCFPLFTERIREAFHSQSRLPNGSTCSSLSTHLPDSFHDFI